MNAMIRSSISVLALALLARLRGGFASADKASSEVAARNLTHAVAHPGSDEIAALMQHAMNGKAFRENYAKVTTEPGKLWEKIKGVTGTTYTWPTSTYIAEPPFFDNFALDKVASSA